MCKGVGSNSLDRYYLFKKLEDIFLLYVVMLFVIVNLLNIQIMFVK